MAERHTIETYGPQPTNRNIWSSRLADSFVWRGGCPYTTSGEFGDHLSLSVNSLQLVARKGPSIKYVTLFWTIFDPPPPVTLCHTSRDPLKTVLFRLAWVGSASG